MGETFAWLRDWLGASVGLAFFGWFVSGVFWFIPRWIWEYFQGAEALPQWVGLVTLSIGISLVGGFLWTKSERENKEYELRISHFIEERINNG
jgi:hypothetical protein